MWAARVDEGFVFGGLHAAMVETLKGVPMLIESSDARVRNRLLPETCDDPDDETEWRQHAVPDVREHAAEAAPDLRVGMGDDDVHLGEGIPTRGVALVR